MLPKVIVGHVVTPSTASQNRQVSSKIFEALGLSLRPKVVDGEYDLPLDLKGEARWKFVWKWNSAANDVDDKVLESLSYTPVLQFVRRLGLIAEDLSAGQHCTEKFCMIASRDIYTPRLENPLEVRRQRVFHCHRVQGRTDLVVLRQERNGGKSLDKWSSLPSK